jgi:hypothetical protein
LPWISKQSGPPCQQSTSRLVKSTLCRSNARRPLRTLSGKNPSSSPAADAMPRNQVALQHTPGIRFRTCQRQPWLSSCPTFEKLHVSNRRAAVTQLDYCFAARHGAFSGRDKSMKLHSLQHCRRVAAQDIFRGVPLSSNEAPYARARTSSRDNRDEENRRIGLDTHTVQLRFARCNGLRSQSSAPTRS